MGPMLTYRSSSVVPLLFFIPIFVLVLRSLPLLSLSGTSLQRSLVINSTDSASVTC